MTDSQPHYRFRCVTCATERSVRRKGTRIRYPCQTCDAVQTFERVGRVTTTPDL